MSTMPVSPRELGIHYKAVRERLRGSAPPPVVKVEPKIEPQPEPAAKPPRKHRTTAHNNSIVRGEPLPIPQHMPGRMISFHIRDVVCAYFGHKPEQLLMPNRCQPFCLHRQLAMYLCVKRTELTLQQIGKAFRGMDHTTVLHAYNKITKLIKLGDPIADDAEKIERLL